MNAEQSPDIAQRLLRRIDRMWTRYEQTGEERWMRAALEADRLYRHAKETGR